MRKHVMVVGVIHIALGMLRIFSAVALAGVSVLAGMNVAVDELPIVLGSLLGVASFVALLAIPSIIAGVGLLKGRPWARYLAMALAVLNLMDIPVGTIFGAYSLWVMLQIDDSEMALQTGEV